MRFAAHGRTRIRFAARGRPRSQGSAREEPEAAAQDLDRLPIPDYGDYFARLAGGPLAGEFVPRVPFESSRGCWWGEKRRCVFCGQASASMAYRRKSAGRAVTELTQLTRRHPGSPVIFTDEILPRDAFDDFLPRVHEALPDLEVVYFEVRPDLDRRQLELLAERGVRRLEAGLETLSTPVLRLMHKGTTALQNLQFLKWARELGIEVVWNLLWGIPGRGSAGVLQPWPSWSPWSPICTHRTPSARSVSTGSAPVPEARGPRHRQRPALPGLRPRLRPPGRRSGPTGLLVRLRLP